ncbi:MAG: ABC transporter ATP-binding protein [Rhodobacteraceae bacterium]|nr:ABC transporter ATP-binding protein [Paracoccaceae bacterium]
MLENLADPYVDTPVKPETRVWRYLRANMAPLRRVILASLVFTVIAATIEVWLIGYAGRLIDTLTTIAPGQLWSEIGLELAGVAVLLLVLRPISHFLREGTNDLGLKPNAATLFRWRAISHVGKQSVGWFQDDLAGRTAIRVVEVGSDAAGVIYSALNAVAYVSAYLIGIIILMASADLRLLWPILLWLGLYAATMRLLIPAFDRATEKFQKTRSALTGQLVDTYANIDTVRLFADRNAQENEAKTKVENTRQAFFALQRVEVAFDMTITVLDGVIMVGLVGYAIVLWQNGAGTVGLVASALALSLRITGMIEWMMSAVSSIFGHIGALREELKTIAQPIAIKDRAGAPMLQLKTGEIRFDGVSHHYGKDAGGLDNLSLTIKAGEKVGLVGRSGAGKSTLVNLLLRFHEVEKGTITIDGQDITSVTQDSLRSSIGMVAQEAALLHRSVRDNIDFGRENVSDDAIITAAQRAEAHDFIQTLQDNVGRTGYDTHVGERGVKLSGGQRQRIAIARVILKDAPILVLDEATSALDSEVEAAIQETLYHVMQDKTVIAIAHRLSTIAQMDRIIVLDAGKIAEQGSHSELLAQNGLYASFWNRQSGGFISTEST